MSIHLSQVILIGILAFFSFYIFWLRTALYDRYIYLLFAALGILLILDPDLTSQFAHLIGIGRGTDLLFYLFILVSLFYAVSLRSQLKHMQQQITQTVRQLALQQPLYGPLSAQEIADLNYRITHGLLPTPDHPTEHTQGQELDQPQDKLP